MATPDSDAREVRRCDICQRETFPTKIVAYRSDLCFRQTMPHDRECWKLGYERLAALVGVEPPLAQRILAALEGAGFTDLHYRGLAAELRERLPR